MDIDNRNKRKREGDPSLPVKRGGASRVPAPPRAGRRGRPQGPDHKVYSAVGKRGLKYFYVLVPSKAKNAPPGKMVKRRVRNPNTKTRVSEKTGKVYAVQRYTGGSAANFNRANDDAARAAFFRAHLNRAEKRYGAGTIAAQKSAYRSMAMDAARSGKVARNDAHYTKGNNPALYDRIGGGFQDDGTGDYGY